MGVPTDKIIETLCTSDCPVDPSFRAISGHLKFSVRRHKFNEDSLAKGLRQALRRQMEIIRGLVDQPADGLINISGRGSARAEDAQGTLSQNHMSPSVISMRRKTVSESAYARVAGEASTYLGSFPRKDAQSCGRD